MKPLPTIHDPRFARKPHHRLDRFLLTFIKDERDLTFVYLQLKITLSVLPLGLLLFVPGLPDPLWWTVAAAYLYLNTFVFKGPMGLMQHCTSHRPLFKPEYGYLNKHLPWIIAPFFGQSPETYFSHHIGMHHVENNLDDDDSSTMAYQRDSLRSFLAYFADFFLLGIVRLSTYLNRKKRRKLLRNAVVGEMLFLAGCIGLCFVNAPATLVVFIIPFVTSRLVMMIGNWTQHAFVDAADPGNPFKNSITCLNVRYNHKCFNDGYHISHHQRPAMHWTEHPDFFLKTLPKYAQNKAIIFDGLDFGRVFFNLMAKRYEVLAQHVVNVDGMFGSDEEIVSVLRQRTMRIVTNETLTLAEVPAA